MILGSSEILKPSLVEAKWFHPQARVTTIPGRLKPIPETETGSLEIELKERRIHSTGQLETGLQMIPPSLVAPLKRGRRINNTPTLPDHGHKVVAGP